MATHDPDHPHPRFALPLYGSVLLALSVLASCTPPPSSELQWEALPGPFARNISTVFPLRTGSGILAGLTNGEIAYSSDRGQHWAYRTPASKGTEVVRFFTAPEQPSLVYAATGRGLFLSADTAHTWRRVPVGEDTTITVLTLAVDPWKPEIRFAGTKGHGLYRSTDSGRSWHPMASAADSVLRTATVWDLALDPGRPDRLVAAIGAPGVTTSSDAGASWQILSRGSASIGAQATHILPHPQNSDILLLGNDAGSMYRSTNFGRLWSPVRPASAGGRILSLLVVPGRPNTVLAGTEAGVLMSTNFGESWQPWGGSLPPLPATLVPSQPPSHEIYAFGPAIGMCVTSDQGATWQPADAYLGGATASDIDISPGGDTVYAVVGSAVLQYAPHSLRWQSVGEGLTGGDVQSLATDPHDPSCLYSTSATGAFRTTDGGAHWLPFARFLQSVPSILVPHPWFPTRTLASGRQGIFFSTNRGSTWRQSQPMGKTPEVHSFTFRQTNAGVVFATASPAAVLFTEDGGISWESTRYGLGADSLLFISLDDKDTKVCYAWTAEGGCYRSLNGGLEWSKFTPPWNASDYVMFASDPRSASQLVAIVNGRIMYLTTNGGTTWNRLLDRRLPGDPVAAAWHAGRGILVVGLRDRGVYQLLLPETLRSTLAQQ